MKKQFEDLLVWKGARELVKKIYGLIEKENFCKLVGQGFSLAKNKQISVIARSLAKGGRRSNPIILNRLLRFPAYCGIARNDILNLLLKTLSP
jgi:hypothetical protein